MTLEFDPNQLQKLPTEQLIGLIVQQEQIIEQLQQEIECLKARVQLDSQTSSKPPSTDLLKKPEKPKTSSDKTKAPKRKPGGQPGHTGSTRKGFGRVDRYELLKPQECLQCGSIEFRETPVSVQRQQVAQLVAHPIEVVEYQQHTCACAQCGQSQTAAWPEGIVPGQDLSVGLQSLLVWLGNYGHLSYEKQQEFLRELGNIEMGVGTLASTNARMASAVKGSVDQLREWVKRQQVVHVDESPWPVLGLKEWLWVITGEQFCLFHPGDTRSRAELISQLGQTFDGVISTDDYSVYNGYTVKAQQKCLAEGAASFQKSHQVESRQQSNLGASFHRLD